MQLPLNGVRVLDMSRYIAGPLCAQFLGDMGADVIKLEPIGGEPARHFPPLVNGESLYVITFNRNKRGITLNTRHPRALPLLEKLVQWADVLVENFRPGTLDRMGLTASRLRDLNPSLVVTSISGFGQTGPNRDRALFDAIAQATSGLMAVTADNSGAPQLVGTFIADFIAGFHGVIATLAALMTQRSHGIGQRADIGSVDALFTTLGQIPAIYRLFGQVPARHGSRDPISAPANTFRTADGYVYLHAGTDTLFEKLRRIDGLEDLRAHEFDTLAGRMQAVDRLETLIERWTQRLTSEEVERIIGGEGIPVGVVASIPRVVNSEQVGAREMVIEVDHPVAGKVPVPGFPIKFTETPAEVRRYPPSVGEHNVEVYSSIAGLGTDDIARLTTDGVI